MFITFEGIEGSGKSTVLERLSKDMRSRGQAPVLTREPGGSALGASLRGVLLDARQQVVPMAELFLYLADRAQHVQQVIRPALKSGAMVFSDRYADSTVVYQGFGRSLDVERLFALNEMAVDGLWPDLTLLFDLEPELGLARARRRNCLCGVEVTEGRFEAEAMAFHRRIRNGYLVWAARHPQRFRVLDASASPDDVYAQAEDVLREVL